MAEILSRSDYPQGKIPRENPLKVLVEKFNSLDSFFKIQVLAIVLFLLVIPATAGLIFDTRQRAEVAGTETEITGTLEVVHSDDFVHEPVYSYAVKMDDGRRIPLKFDREKPTSGGSRVRIKGTRKKLSPTNSQISVTQQVASLSEAPLTVTQLEVISAPPSTAKKKIALLLVNFSNDMRKPITVFAANHIMFVNPDSVKAFFEEESRGAVSITGKTFGWYTIPSTNEECKFYAWGEQARSAAKSAGVDLSAYTNVVVAWPRAPSCSWAGSATIFGSDVWININSDLDPQIAIPLRVPSHELSHNFGVMHASSFRCTSSAGSTEIVSLSNFCKRDNEFGDPFTIMGNHFSAHNHAQMVGELGWLKEQEVQTVTASGVYVLTPILGTPPDTIKLLRIPRGDGTYFYLDFRSVYGCCFDNFFLDNPVVKGVTIRLSPGGYAPSNFPSNSFLIDATPETDTFRDAPLAQGRSIIDPVSKIKFTTTALSLGKTATVKIEMNTNPTPTPPPSSPTQAPTPTPTPGIGCTNGYERCIAGQPHSFQKCNNVNGILQWQTYSNDCGSSVCSLTAANDVTCVPAPTLGGACSIPLGYSRYRKVSSTNPSGFFQCNNNTWSSYDCNQIYNVSSGYLSVSAAINYVSCTKGGLSATPTPTPTPTPSSPTPKPTSTPPPPTPTPGGGCTNGYQDKDIDSFGAGAYGCYSGVKVVQNNTDCYDANANAYPQSGYSSATNRGDGSFDYNCNGTNDIVGTRYKMSGLINPIPLACTGGTCGTCKNGTFTPSNTNTHTNSCGEQGGSSCSLTYFSNSTCPTLTGTASYRSGCTISNTPCQ